MSFMFFFSGGCRLKILYIVSKRTEKCVFDFVCLYLYPCYGNEVYANNIMLYFVFKSTAKKVSNLDVRI